MGSIGLVHRRAATDSRGRPPSGMLLHVDGTWPARSWRCYGMRSGFGLASIWSRVGGRWALDSLVVPPDGAGERGNVITRFVPRVAMLAAVALASAGCSSDGATQESTLEGTLTGNVQFGGEGNQDGLVNAKACNED